MHITSNVRDSTRIPLGAVLVVLPMLSNSEARITAITNGLDGGPQWNMSGAPLTIGPFDVPAEVRIECVEGDVAWDTVYIQDLELSAEFDALSAQVTTLQETVDGLDLGGISGDITGLQGDVTTLNGEVATLQGDVTDIQTFLSGVDLSGMATSIAALNSEYTTLSGTVSGLSTSVGTLNTEYTALNTTVTGLSTTVAGHTTSINALLSGSNYEETIVGLTDGLVVDNAATFQSYLGPAELGGTIVTGTDGIQSNVPDSGNYLVGSRVDLDPQISLDWTGRGAIVLVPSAHMPGIVPGTAGTAVRTGGGAPNSLLRPVRRAPGINKEAYESLIGGFNLDASSVTLWGTFATDASGNFTTTKAHGRAVGDMIFFDLVPAGTGLPSPLVVSDFTIATAFYIKTVADSTHFTVSATLGGSTVVTAAGSGVWTTNLYGMRVPNNQPGTVSVPINQNDPDQDFDNRKNYTGGSWRDMDISSFSASGMYWEASNGRVHLHSVRAIGNRIHGFHIDSNDTVLSGHWAAGGNGGFGLRKGASTGLYAGTGNLWGSPTNRSVNCGALWLHDPAFWVIFATEFNDWAKLEGIKNFNNAGAFVGNMMHPHSENFSSDGICYNVLNDGDTRLQSQIGITGYQGVGLYGQAWSRTEKFSGNTPGTLVADGAGVMHGTTDGTTGTATQWLVDIGGTAGTGSTQALVQIFDGVCTAPDVKPWIGPFATATFTNGSTSVNYTGHPFLAGDRIYFHGASLPAGITADTQYYVSAVVDANNFKISLTWGGANVSPTANGSGTCYWMSSCPYNFHNGGGGAGVYVDSYRGIINLWQHSGVAPKWLIGMSGNSPWEGNPSYQGEIGSQASGTQKRYGAYGQWEFDNGIGFQDGAQNSNTYSNADGLQTFNAVVKAGDAVRHITLQDNVFSTGTITLPGTDVMTCSKRLFIYVTGKAVTALTWAFTAGGWASGSPTAPKRIPAAGAVIELWYSHVDQGWIFLNASSDGGQIGRTDGTMTPAGVIGEMIQSKVASSSAVNIATATGTNLTSITLTAGDWDVSGQIQYTATGGTTITPTLIKAAISTVSGTAIPATDATAYGSRSSSVSVASGVDFDAIPLGVTRVTVAAGSTQQVWLNGKVTFGGTGTPTVGMFGSIRGLRVR